MKIMISGGTGFVGRELVKHLRSRGDEIIILTRRQSPEKNAAGVKYVVADPGREGKWQQHLAEVDAVVNLAGAPIFRRWTRKNKKLIHDSRTVTTRNIVNGINRGGREGMVLVSASAVGYYGTASTAAANEESPAGVDFLARVACDWEEESAKGACRVVLCRFGMVLGPGGGALAKMLPAFRAGLGSPLGRGDQPFPWIHIADLIRIITTAIDDPNLSGPINCVAPEQTDNRSFCRALAKALGRPMIMPAVPAFIVRLFTGELGDIVLKGRHVRPEKLLRLKYKFLFTDISTALEEIISGTGACRRSP